MYEEVFNFKSRPFTLTPFINHYFPTSPMQQAMEVACRSIDRESGPVIATGALGTGKSLFMALLADKYKDQFNVANLSCGPMEERRDLLQSILFELKQPYRDMSEGELRLSLIDFIKPGPECPNGVLLLVDDAQSLSPDLIDELRLVTNMVHGGIPRVRLTMAGTPRLEEILTDPKLESFNQRIAGRCFFDRLNREETREYIHSHIDGVGGDGNTMFDDATCKAIHESTGGVPRFINQLCEQSMITAAVNGFLVVESNMVANAWAEVQGLPVNEPVFEGEAAPVQEDSNWTVIEFGQLDEEPSTSDHFVENTATAETSSTEFGELEDTDPEQVVTSGSVEDSVEYQLAGQTPDADTQIPIDVEAIFTDQENILEQADQAANESQDLEQLLDPLTDNHFTEASAEHPTVPAAEWEAQPDESDETQSVAVESTTSETFTPELDAEDANTFHPHESVPDPFAEAFDSEEQIEGGVAEFVATQNAGSLSVTSADLGLLQPLDTVPDLVSESATGETVYEPQETLEEHYISAAVIEEAETLATQQSQASPAVEVIGATASESDETPADSDIDPAATTEREEPTQHIDPADTKQEVADQDSTDTPAAESGYHTHVYSPSDEVKQQAESLLGRLEPLPLPTFPVSHETADQLGTDGSTDAAEVGTDVAVQAQATPQPEPLSETDELSDVQQILNEILEQKSVLASQAAPRQADPVEPEAEPASYSMIRPGTEQADGSLNEENLNMAFMSSAGGQPSASHEPTAHDAAQPPVSTGRAERMDYEQLFEQLRDAGNGS